MEYFRLFSRFKLAFLLLIIPVLGLTQEDNKPILWLSFDRINIDEKLHFRTVEDQVTKQSDTIKGSYAVLKNGVFGKSLLLDGYSAYLSSAKIPSLKGPFTVEAWIAIGAYPTNYCPVAEQRTLGNNGFSLGINHEGKPGFKVATQNGWIELEGNMKIPLLQWVHICGVYDTKKITLYFNGEKVVQKEVISVFSPAACEIFYCGITSQKSVPKGTIWLKGTESVNHFFDGLIDELKIWDTALTEKDFDAVKKEIITLSAPALEKRSLPKLPELKRFGATYADLKFYESWDKFWRISGLPDVVVSFDKFVGHFVFWRGTSYIPHLVTENGIWYNNEFNETWSNKGCHEPMSDKRCENSQVKIIENTPARCVVQWRYALIDNWYNKSNIDPITGWGDWTDEIYTIYPDGVAVRSQTLHSSNLSSRFEWHEGIVVMGQGQSPEDVLYPEALTMANMGGREHIYSWEPVDSGIQNEGITYIINKKDRLLTELPGANIQLINTRSLLKPFTIINPDDKPKWDFYMNHFRRDYSMFPWWNHWPTAFKPSDGRYAMDKDRASHSSLTHVTEWKSYRKTEYSETRLMLIGLTQKKASGLVPLTKSWSHPPEMVVNGKGIYGKGYEPSERAYKLECSKVGDCYAFNVKLNCSVESPAINPAFVIANWGTKDILVKVNGQKISDKNLYCYGIVNTTTGSDLILWFNQKFDEIVNIEVFGK